MSWTTQIPPTDANHFLETLDSHGVEMMSGEPVEEAAEQFDAVKGAVAKLIAGNALSTDGQIFANLSGHATPGHHGPESISIHIHASVAAEQTSDETRAKQKQPESA